MKAQRMVVEVDELVLHGFDPRDRYGIGDALQAELAALLGAMPIGAAPRKPVDHIDAGAFDMRANESAASIGLGIARSVHGGIS